MAGKDSTGDCLGVSFSGYSYLLTRPDTDTGIYTGIKFINQSDIRQNIQSSVNGSQTDIGISGMNFHIDIFRAAFSNKTKLGQRLIDAGLVLAHDPVNDAVVPANQ